MWGWVSPTPEGRYQKPRSTRITWEQYAFFFFWPSWPGHFLSLLLLQQTQASSIKLVLFFFYFFGAFLIPPYNGKKDTHLIQENTYVENKGVVMRLVCPSGRGQQPLSWKYQPLKWENSPDMCIECAQKTISKTVLRRWTTYITKTWFIMMKKK